jgi:hypothetical protein
MRPLLAILALLGLAGIVLGVLTMIHGAAAGPRSAPFVYENYGGPGPIIAGLIVLTATWYLRSSWKSRD